MRHSSVSILRTNEPRSARTNPRRIRSPRLGPQKSPSAFRLHGGLRDVIEKIANDPANMDEKRIRFPEWQEPHSGRQGVLFALFVLCIILEWIVRRWWGMV